MVDGITIQLNKVLSEYSREVTETVNKALANVGKQAVQKLKATSPKRTGKYAGKWKLKREGSLGKADDFVIYNEMGQLTHLLENGHVIRNKKGTYGRTRAFRHIAPVEEWVSQELPEEIRKELEG